jgi:hypothetical protein
MSYRRADAAPYARLLQSQLRERFPDVPVFMDLDSIEAGLDFAEVIQENLGSCAVLVVLIGRQWATLTDERGRRRLDDPDDFVRFEVQAALERGVRVIPVLVDGAKPPRQDELPAGLDKLARLQALELSYGRYQYDAKRLLDQIQEVLGPASGTGQKRSRRRTAAVVRTAWITGFIGVIVLIGVVFVVRFLMGNHSRAPQLSGLNRSSAASATTGPSEHSTAPLSFSEPSRSTRDKEGKVVDVKLIGTVPQGEYLWIFVYHLSLYYPQGTASRQPSKDWYLSGVNLGSSLASDRNSWYTVYAVLVNSQTNSAIRKNFDQWSNYGMHAIPGGSESTKIAHIYVYRNH